MASITPRTVFWHDTKHIMVLSLIVVCATVFVASPAKRSHSHSACPPPTPPPSGRAADCHRHCGLPRHQTLRQWRRALVASAPTVLHDQLCRVPPGLAVSIWHRAAQSRHPLSTRLLRYLSLSLKVRRGFRSIRKTIPDVASVIMLLWLTICIFALLTFRLLDHRCAPIFFFTHKLTQKQL